MNEIAQKTVLISGGAGSMGQLVSDYISSRNDFIMTAIHDPNYDGQEYKIYKDLTNIEAVSYTHLTLPTSDLV